MTDLEKLEEVRMKMFAKGSTGADMSPGDPDCYDAYELLTEYAALVKVQRAQEANDETVQAS